MELILKQYDIPLLRFSATNDSRCGDQDLQQVVLEVLHSFPSLCKRCFHCERRVTASSKLGVQTLHYIYHLQSCLTEDDQWQEEN